MGVMKLPGHQQHVRLPSPTMLALHSMMLTRVSHALTQRLQPLMRSPDSLA